MIDIDRELAHVQRERLAGDATLVSVGHLTLLAVLGFLLWPDPPVRARLVWWSLAVVLATLARALWQRRGRDVLIEQRRTARTLRTLQGILPICASCKRIKEGAGRWQQMESYVREHSEAEFSHGLCPDCAARDWGAGIGRR